MRKIEKKDKKKSICKIKMSVELCNILENGLNIVEYIVDNEVEYNKNINNVMKIRLNFYQLWAMFNQLPVVYEKICEDGEIRKYYEYRIKGDNDIYIIYGYGSEGFLKLREWNIGSTTNNKNEIEKFLRHLEKALKMYNEYYKGIERHDFTSDNTDINEHMSIIKNGLLKYRETLKYL
jgi:hypothetical protein